MFFLTAVLAAQPALAQWDLLKKGATMARAMTRDFTEEEEIAIGRIVAARVLSTYPRSGNEKLQRYVRLVGQTVAEYSDRPTLDWHFVVIETPMVNAFSCPGGYVFITTGALDQITSEAELAAVLGHEIAHATERHILREIKRANVITEGLNIAQSELGGGGMSDELARKVSDLAYDRLFNTGIGRKEELAADRVGVKFAADAGYRSSAYRSFLESLEALAAANSSSFSQLGSTHPRPADRLRAIQSRLADRGELLAERWARLTR
ncbi:MAG TPA: M48 family metalloprotease [Thermoanaerobaculia bacterium]|nr:M48 family metalloprotease [Thermoanaerobaculia bacterium]